MNDGTQDELSHKTFVNYIVGYSILTLYPQMFEMVEFKVFSGRPPGDKIG